MALAIFNFLSRRKENRCLKSPVHYIKFTWPGDTVMEWTILFDDADPR